MAETLSTLSIISYIIAGVAIAIAVILWFFFDIPTVIGDLSGRTARKSIAKMRVANEKSGAKKYQESKINKERGKLTETMKGAGKSDLDDRPDTGLLVENKVNSIVSEETGLLTNESTDVLDGEETGLLVDENATVALKKESVKTVRTGGKKLNLIEEIRLIHTDEVIE